MNDGTWGRRHARLLGLLRALWPSAAVLLCAGLALVGALEIVGPCIWDPVELELAEIARTHQHTAGALPSPGVSSVSFFFRVLGTSAWAGRAPMLVFAIGAAVATYLFAARFLSRRAAIFAVLVLATTPLYFTHARTMTGEMIPIACIVAAFAGFAHAAFATGTPMKRRVASLGLALAAAMLGSLSRGALVCVAVPALAVGFAWLFERRASPLRGLGDTVLVVGAGAALLSLAAPLIFGATLTGLFLGPAHAVTKTATFDSPMGQLAYALFPWSAIAPLALAALGRTVQRGAAIGPRTATLFAVVLALGAHAALAPRGGPAPFAGVAFVAIALGAMLSELDTADPSALAAAGRLTALGTMVAVAYLVTDDLSRAPEKILEPFALAPSAESQAFPAAFAIGATRGMRIAAMALGPFAALALFFDPAPFRKSAKLARVATYLASHRGVLLLAGGLAAGLVLRVHLYPSLLSRVAPDSALEAFGQKHAAGDRLGLLGVSKRTLAYVRGAPTESVAFTDPAAAATFLAPPDPNANAPQAREWLALGAHDLPVVNSLYRQRRGHNAPILAGRGDNVLLAVSDLKAGEPDENPLSDFLPNTPPVFSRPMQATFGDSFEATSWEVTGEGGEKRATVPPRGNFHIRFALRVKKATPGGYCTFIHIDHSPTRVSVEHKDFAAYPMTLWRVGDVVVDDFAVHLPAHFSPGKYSVSFGVGVLPCEDDHRMPVTSGPHDGHDRVTAGQLEVQ